MDKKVDLFSLVRLAVIQDDLHALEFLYKNSNMEDEILTNAIHTAAQNNRLDIARFLIKNDADVNGIDRSSYTPFFQSILCKHFDFADLLLENGASVENFDDSNISDFLALCYRGEADKEQLTFLIKRGANIFHKDNAGRDSLFAAATCNNIFILNFLLEHGLDINSIDKSGMTAVQFAIKKKKIKAIDFFVENYERLNENNKKLLNGYRLEKLFA
jgi:ankyrin repeat protein